MASSRGPGAPRGLAGQRAKSARRLKNRSLGADVKTVQDTFKGVFNLKDLATDGSQFDQLFADGDTFAVGDIEARVIATPGHTPACVTYVIGDAAFVGDTLFMPDFGSARTDFPGGSAPQLYDSIRKILALPDDTRLFLCHDYPSEGSEPIASVTVAESAESNIHLKRDTARDDFIALREGRDAGLGLPKLILPAIQVNVLAGAAPPPERNGASYLKIPFNTTIPELLEGDE